MKLSAYNILVEDLENGDTIIFNSLYGSTTVFNTDEMALVKEIMDNPGSKHDSAEKILATLVSQKYLIDEDDNEMAIIENRKRKGIIDSNRLDVIIMPTLECNFRCVYCYEEKMPGKMCRQTVDSIKTWLKLEIPKRKLVLLSWFGGEPMIGFKQLEEISTYANEIAAACETEMIINITTNGALFTEDKIQRLVNLKILNYQITIDGIAETHDQLRPMINGKGTFKKVFSSIIQLVKASPDVKVTLRVNFNHTNLHTVPSLLNLFPKEHRNQLRLTLEPIFGSCEYNATDNLEVDDISKTLAAYYKLASELGYDITIAREFVETGKLVYCYAERENQVIINYNGEIFKCSVDSFESSNSVGVIRKDGVLERHTAKWDAWMNIPLFDVKCESCSYLPLCMGGCRKTRLKSRNTGGVCSLIPSNASYVLKQISYNGLKKVVIKNSK